MTRRFARYDSPVPSIDLPPERSAAARARRFARDLCARWNIPNDTTEDIELLVSELVTNAVLHARSDARVTIDHLGDRVRVTVSDHSSSPPRLREYGPEAVTGRGVFLVNRLAQDWGVDTGEGNGKHVWFELGVATANEGSRT
jgi:anti-sigma regulatory factor (Ser/Thr protein kinase)